MITSAGFAHPFNLLSHSSLIGQMVRRQVDARYRGSLLGIFWSLVTPLLMLAVYTFVFGVIFSPRPWRGDGQTPLAPFALILFSGLIPYNLFSEVIGKAPGLIVSNRNFVKKVLFPIEVLPVISLGAALVQACISYAILIVGLIVATHTVSWTWLLLPIVLAPLLIFTLGLAWALAAFGVYLRDLSQLMPPLLGGLMFMSAIVYPLSALPEYVRHVLLVANPLVFPIEQVRRVVIYNETPLWSELLLYTLLAIAVAQLGYKVFQKLRKGFADVV